jgi:hypothetical protein
MNEQESRDIETICLEEGGFNIELLGKVYCSIGLTRKIECPYQSHYQDQNNLYCCTNLIYMSLNHEIDTDIQ